MSSDLDGICALLDSLDISYCLDSNSSDVSSDPHVLNQINISSDMNESVIESMVIDNASNKDEEEKTRKVDGVECELCGKHFKFTIHLNEHRRNIHEQKEPSHICSDCGAKFNKKSNLTRHLKLYCVKNHTYKCIQCSKTFPSEHVLGGCLRVF